MNNGLLGIPASLTGNFLRHWQSGPITYNGVPQKVIIANPFDKGCIVDIKMLCLKDQSGWVVGNMIHEDGCGSGLFYMFTEGQLVIQAAGALRGYARTGGGQFDLTAGSWAFVIGLIG